MFRFLQRSLVILLVVALACPSEAFAARKKKKRNRSQHLTANSAILIDFNHNRRYFGRDIEQRVAPASTTKVLTAILVLEKLPLDKYVTVNASALDVQPTKMDAIAGEQYRVRDLLYALLMKSANDAAEVLAEAVAGSQTEFVAMMNNKARDIGAKHSLFANAHGLPSRGAQYTTAYDMALIFRQALKYDFFRKAITFKYRIIYSKDGRRLFLKSHNKSLFLNWKADVYGKTGYTRQAQSCFVGYVPKGNDTLILSVFGCCKRWEDIKFIIERYGHLDL